MNHYRTTGPGGDFPHGTVARRQRDHYPPGHRDQGLAFLLRHGVATLEREAPRTVALARQAGVEIEYVGIGPLLDGHQVFFAEDSPWVIGPARPADAALIPRKQAQALILLDQSPVTFPLVYVAHQLAADRFPGSPAEATGTMSSVSPSRAEELVGPVPPPAAVVELGDRLSQRARQVFAAMRMAAMAAGRVAAAPFALGAAAIASMATLDPILFGVIPAVSSDPGEPGAWYVLARWDW